MHITSPYPGRFRAYLHSLRRNHRDFSQAAAEILRLYELADPARTAAFAYPMSALTPKLVVTTLNAMHDHISHIPYPDTRLLTHFLLLELEEEVLTLHVEEPTASKIALTIQRKKSKGKSSWKSRYTRTR